MIVEHNCYICPILIPLHKKLFSNLAALETTTSYNWKNQAWKNTKKKAASTSDSEVLLQETHTQISAVFLYKITHVKLEVVQTIHELQEKKNKYELQERKK